jgi:hypothetical protein
VFLGAKGGQGRGLGWEQLSHLLLAARGLERRGIVVCVSFAPHLAGRAAKQDSAFISSASGSSSLQSSFSLIAVLLDRRSGLYEVDDKLGIHQVVE